MLGELSSSDTEWGIRVVYVLDSAQNRFLEAAGFERELLDVRIYGVALSAEQVGLSFELGPDAEL